MDTDHAAGGPCMCITVTLLNVPSYKPGTEIPTLLGRSQD